MKINKGYHGYLGLPRQSKLLLKELGCELFGFYLALVMMAIWDRGNKNFGRVMKSQTEIAKELDMDQGTVSRKFKELENRNRYSVIRRKDGMILGFFPLFLYEVVSKTHSNDYADLHTLYADMHKINAELHENYATSQDRRTQKTSQSIYPSSNDNVSFQTNTNDVSEDYIDVDEIDKGIQEQRDKERRKVRFEN